MGGNYKCVNCGHTDYYDGSPLWVQRCRKCHKPVGLKIPDGQVEKPERQGAQSHKTIQHVYVCYDCGKQFSVEILPHSSFPSCPYCGGLALLKDVIVETHEENTKNRTDEIKR